jgi:hypothetical protein
VLPDSRSAGRPTAVQLRSAEFSASCSLAITCIGCRMSSIEFFASSSFRQCLRDRRFLLKS